MIDTHCHLDDPRFDVDRESCLAKAEQLGIQQVLVPSIKAEWWPRVKAVCEQSDKLFAAYGLHPMFEPEHKQQDIKQLSHWLECERPVAIGECGLDFYIKNPNKKRQLKLFEAQVELASESGLPLIIHARKSVEEVLQLLRHYPGVKGVCHSYSGSLQQALQLIELGFFIGLGGPLTYSRATRLHRLLIGLPIEALVLETDAPDQPPQSHHGSRNEPAFLSEIVRSISQIVDRPEKEVISSTSKNARRLFKLDDLYCQ